MTSTKDLGTAVVGCGYWGRNLVRNFAELSTLQVCCDTNPSTLESLALTYPGVERTSSYDEVLSNPSIQAIVLATPAPNHASMAIAALRAGKHVFVEKPLALSVTDAEEVVSVAESEDRILMVGHLLEYHPAIEYVKGLIDGGELGEVCYCYTQRVNLGRLRFDENALWSLAPHDVAVLLYLLDEEPESVSAIGQAFLQPGIEDVVFLTMQFPSGRLANVQVSWLDPHKNRQLTVVGSKKMVVFDDMAAREKLRIYDKGVDRQPTEDAAYANYAELLSLREGDIVVPAIDSTEPLAVECSEFLRSVVTGIPPRSDGQDGLRVVRVLEAASEHLQQGFPRFKLAGR